MRNYCELTFRFVVYIWEKRVDFQSQQMLLSLCIHFFFFFVLGQSSSAFTIVVGSNGGMLCEFKMCIEHGTHSIRCALPLEHPERHDIRNKRKCIAMLCDRKSALCFKV